MPEASRSRRAARLGGLAGDEQLDRRDPRRRRGRDEILALDGEQPLPLPLPARRQQPSRQPQAWVGGRGDQTRLGRGSLGRFALKRGLRLLGDDAERDRIGHGEVGQDLAVELDARRRQPEMNWLYERPWCRAPALMRVIHSRRIVRFFAFRSR